jgi:GT2 family glycosyltransferase
VTNDSGCNIRKSILRSLRDKELPKIFFSLVDYRNNYFLSSDPKDIIHFYEGFESRDELIEWMKERPKGSYEIKEVEGEKDIIVVVPTADFEGEYAKGCREEIFKGLHIIFVISGKGNNYFNYGHNCNVGIERAMEYNPKWVVLSNDDMVKEDPIERLSSTLLKLNNEEEIIVHTLKSGKYHSRDALISTRTIRRKIVLCMMGKLERIRMSLESRFDVKYIVGSSLGFYRFLYSPILRVEYSGTFTIMSSVLIKRMNGIFFDETFINGAEDIDIALLLKQKGTKVKYVDYKIGDIIGGTIGPYDIIRRTRDLVNTCYLNTKLLNSYLPQKA